MNLLLDTHIMLWYSQNNPRLSETTRDLILDPNNGVSISIVSLFELSIKIKVGKLHLGSSIANFWEGLRSDQIQTLPITLAHLTAYDALSLKDEHRDPFDRLILATALAEGMTLISQDKKFASYKEIVPIIGA